MQMKAIKGKVGSMWHHEGAEKCMQEFCSKYLNGRDHVKDLGLGWRII
jgi:hypothetical protein